MPTSSERLYTRAGVYRRLSNALVKMADVADTTLQVEEYTRLALRFDAEYHRLMRLAHIRAEKEKMLKHRRGTS
jgi:hypothetical protein